MTEKCCGWRRFMRRVLGRRQRKEEIQPAVKQEGRVACGGDKTPEEILFSMKFGKR